MTSPCSLRHPHRTPGRLRFLALSTALALWPLAATAQPAPTRLPDKDVKALIEQVNDLRDKFEGNLDNDVKKSKLRGASGETDVSAFLDDFQDNVNKLKDRFTDDYSASTEAATVLKQANAIDTFMRNSPGVTKGRSEWERLAASLKSLAQVYASTFPLPEGAAVRRMNDKETATAANDLAEAANRLKSDYDKTSTLAKPDRDAAKKDADALKKAAQTVKSRTEDGKPATAEFRQLVDLTAKVRTFIEGHQIPTAATDWHVIDSALGKLKQAFNEQ
jgi:hypothetical protein